MHYRPGIEIVPGYRLQRMLGRGGFGEVWQAEGPGRVSAAVKIIDKVEDKAGRKEFRALKLIKDLRHPNLVSITGFWLKDAEGTLLDSDAYIDESGASEVRPSELIVAMDLCEKSLLDRLAECRKGLADDTPGGIPLDELLEYMEAAAKAIDYLNIRHQIQHRDIKPHNIMIVGGSAQVCDFGLASAISTARTSMGGAGSLAYMAPEVYSTKLPSNATDQYSLAITYCELRTGRLPLSDVESFAVLDDAKRKGILDLSLLDERERGVIQRAAATDPAARFPTCYDMVQELRRALSSGVSVSAPARAEPIAGYQLERNLRDRDGEEIWDAIDPDGLHVLLVVRTLAEAPATASWSTLTAVRDVSRSNPRLAEVYEFACLSATDKVLPARLFKLPNPPAPTKTIVAGRRLPNNLSERLSSGGVPIKRLLLLLGDLAEALDYFNAPQHDVGGTLVGFQHANVRPVNFLLDDDRAILSNFASAQVLAGEETEFAAGKQLPDSAFTPPEFTAGKITRWSDQYMLAVSYLQLRTGKPSASLSGSTGSGNRPDARSRLDMSELRPGEREIVARATNADPRKRFATCCEFAAALGKAWDEIFATEPPPPPPTASPRKSSQDPAAATLDAAAVESVSLSGLRDSAQTVMEPRTPAGRSGATLVPSAIETRPPMDTNPDAPLAPPTPRRVKDAAHGAAPRPKAAGRREATLDAETTPWWRTRKALGAALAAIALGVAIPVGMSLFSGGNDPIVDPRGGGKDKPGQDTPAVDPAIARIRGEIEKLIGARSFVAAHAKLSAERTKLGEAAGAISEELELAWSASAVDKAKQGAIRNDATMLAAAATDAAALIDHYPESQEGRQALAAAGTSLVELLKRTLAKADSTPAELNAVTRNIATLLTALATIKPSDTNLTAASALVKARAERRTEPGKRHATLASVRAENLTDPRDKALLETLRALGDEKTSSDAAKLESLESAYRNRLDPFERGELVARIKALRSGEDELQKQIWAALLAELRKRVDQNGATLIAARTDMESLRTRNPAVWQFLTAPSNASAFREYQSLRILATLRSDDLETATYTTALEDLNEHIRGEKVAADAPALCAAALERALKLESVLSYRADEKDTAATAERLVGLAQDVAKFAAAEFSQHADAINKSLADVSQRRVALAVTRLRTLRDAANFAALSSYAAGVKEIVSVSPPARILRTACAVECDLQVDKSPALADRDELRSSQNAADAADKRYVEFVAAIARKDTLSDQLAASAEAVYKSYSGEITANSWRDHDSRKRFVYERLADAAKAQSTDKIADISNPFYAPGSDAAKQSAKWMTLAMQTAGSCKTAPNTQTLLSLRYLEALASYYAAPEDATVCKTVAGLTDAFFAPENNSNPPLQVLLVNARSHAVSGDVSSSVIALARLYDACRVAMAATSGPDPKAIDAQVLAAAVTLVESTLKANGSKLSDDARRSAARLVAARGRFAHLYPAVQERVREQLTAAGDKRTVARAAFDWFDAAVKLDPSHADYYYGRGYSCDLRNDMSYAERAAQMEADAKLALAEGRQPKDFPAAYGLRGLGLLYQSLSIGDYGQRRAVLRQADEAYKKAIAGCDALRNKPAAATYPDMESDYPLFLNGRGNVLLQLANFDTDPTTQRKFLTEALRLALQMTDDRSDSEEPTKLIGVHPEWAYQLAGNTLEDFGWVLKQPEYYQLALIQFTKAEGAATRLSDPAGANLSRYKRARANFKLGSEGYLAAIATLRSLPVPSGGDAARATQLKLLRERAELALKDADREMAAFLAEASASSSDTAVAEVAEANAYLARIRLTNVNNGLWSSDEYATAMQFYDKAIAAAQRQALSPLDRATFMLEQSDAAMSFALLARSQPADMADRFKKAREIAEALAADEKADATMRAKAYLMVARIRVMQATRAGEYRNEIFAAFDKAIAVAAQSAENVAAARAQRGEYRARLAQAVKPPTAVEISLMAEAAADYFAALPKGEAMSRDRLRWGRDLAIVTASLTPPADATAKAAFDRARAEYVARVREICAQLDGEFATRFNRQERMDYAASASDTIVQAKRLFGYAPTSPEAKKLDATIQAIAAAEAAARREFDKWWERRPTFSK